jgi:hypothetical protein
MYHIATALSIFIEKEDNPTQPCIIDYSTMPTIHAEQIG